MSMLDQKLSQLIRGVQTTLSGKPQQLTINGQSYEPASLLTALEAQAAPFNAADIAHEALRKAVADREAATPAALAFYKGVASVLLGMYGRDTATLATFGLAPRKPKRQLTAEEQLKAAAKAKVTRQLRGTIGRRKKEAIKAQGTVTVSATLGGAATPASGAPAVPPSPVQTAGVGDGANGASH